MILLIVAPSAALFLTSAIGVAAFAIFSLLSGGDDPAGSMITAGAAAFQGLLLGLIAWTVFQQAGGVASASRPEMLPRRGSWAVVALGLAALALTVGTLAARPQIDLLSMAVLPALTIVVLVSPIWIFSTWGAGGIDLGPRWRAFGVFGLSMSATPLVLITIEILVALVMLVIAALAVATRPEFVQELQHLGSSLEGQRDPEQILRLVSPIVLRPAVIAGILGYIAVLVPMIEELLKPLGVWLFSSRIKSPAQGFGLGILCGAAYSLVEGLGLVGRGGPDWALAVGVRAGTGLLHIATTGLMGWAIISAIHERRLFRMLAAYALAVTIHGLWNASAVAVALAAMANAVGDSQLLTPVLSAAVASMAVLFAGMLAMLVASNRKLTRVDVPAGIHNSAGGQATEEQS